MALNWTFVGILWQKPLDSVMYNFNMKREHILWKIYFFISGSPNTTKEPLLSFEILNFMYKIFIKCSCKVPMKIKYETLFFSSCKSVQEATLK